MSVLRVTLTEDMLKLISCIRFEKLPDDLDAEQEQMNWGLDFANLYGGDLTFENISYILGIYDKHIEGTEENPLGAVFPKDVENYMWETHGYIVEHIEDIEDIVHQFSIKGGVTPGTYKCQSYVRIWEKE